MQVVSSRIRQTIKCVYILVYKSILAVRRHVLGAMHEIRRRITDDVDSTPAGSHRQKPSQNCIYTSIRGRVPSTQNRQSRVQWRGISRDNFCAYHEKGVTVCCGRGQRPGRRSRGVVEEFILGVAVYVMRLAVEWQSLRVGIADAGSEVNLLELSRTEQMGEERMLR